MDAAAHGVGLQPQHAVEVRTVHPAVFGEDVAHAAGDLAADGDAAVAVLHLAVADDDVLARHVDAPAVALRPDLIAMQSSPVSKVQPSISTSAEDSGSQPSLFGPWLDMVTPRTVTLRQSTGCISHIGELRIVTPSMSTLRQRYGWMNMGRR